MLRRHCGVETRGAYYLVHCLPFCYNLVLMVAGMRPVLLSEISLLFCSLSNRLCPLRMA